MTVKRFLIFWAVVAVVAAGAYLGFTQFDRLCTELAIAHFRARPSAPGARTLAELMDEESATPAQVQRILPLLLTPKVTRQEEYPLGETPTIRVELPFEVAFRNLMVDANESVWAGGVNRYGAGMTGAQTLRPNPHSLSFHPAPTEPGTYKMQVRYTYTFRPQRRRVWQWDPAHGILLPRRQFVKVAAVRSRKPKYEWRVTVPVEIVVVRQPSLQASS
jgi:hypothetical protein